MPYRVGIATSHPIQYKIPWYRALTAHPEIDLTVFYAMLPDAMQQGDGFGVSFSWDLPLLEGYEYEVLENVASQPSVTQFRGCDTPGIRDIVKRGGFDAFITNGWVVKSCIQALRSCRKHGVPCLVRGEANALRPRVWWKRLGHRWLMRQFSAFLSIGQANRDFYLSNGVLEERIFSAPYCVDNDRFAAATEELRPHRAAIRKEWGIPEGAFTFLFCAKFEDKKRPLDLLKALSTAVRKPEVAQDGIQVLMVGDGDLRPECERMIRDERLPVTCLGFLNQTEIPKAYAAADCLVLPSDYGETWGLVVNEAMACGRPAIVSDRVGCHPDLVHDGETGAVFPFGDTDALADRLTAFVREPKRAEAMGLKARNFIAKYCVQTVVNGTVDAVTSVCRRAPRPVREPVHTRDGHR